MWLNVIQAKLNLSELAGGRHILQYMTVRVALWEVVGPLWGFVASAVLHYCFAC